MSDYAVHIVTNVTTHESVVVARVQADSYEDAEKVAIDAGYIPLFKTFRLEKVA